MRSSTRATAARGSGTASGVGGRSASRMAWIVSPGAMYAGVPIACPVIVRRVPSAPAATPTSAVTGRSPAATSTLLGLMSRWIRSSSWIASSRRAPPPPRVQPVTGATRRACARPRPGRVRQRSPCRSTACRCVRRHREHPSLFAKEREANDLRTRDRCRAEASGRRARVCRRSRLTFVAPATSRRGVPAHAWGLRVFPVVTQRFPQAICRRYARAPAKQVLDVRGVPA